jgi:hypothetical protein
MTQRNLYLLAIAFVFLMLQNSIVWINEEILLVISFILFYILSYQQLRNSLNDFFIERKNSFQNNFFIFLKDLAIKDLRKQKEFQYFKNLNLANLANNSLEQQTQLFEFVKKNIQESRKNYFENHCLDILQLEESYKTELLSFLTDAIIQETFHIPFKKNPSQNKEFLSNQIQALKTERK